VSIFLVLAMILLIGTLHQFLLSFHAGIYPNRYILRKRASALGIGSAAFFFISLLF